MKEQVLVISEVLTNTNEDWTCAFHVRKEIGGYAYDIAIEPRESKLELTAKLPVSLEFEDRSDWSGRIRAANRDLDCGAFSLCGEGTGVCYRLYSLNTHEGEVKSLDAVETLLRRCYAALERCAGPMLAQKQNRSLLDSFYNLIGMARNDGDELIE